MIAQTIIGMNRLMQDMFTKEFHRKHVTLVPEIADALKVWAGTDRVYILTNVSFSTKNVSVEVQDTQDSKRVFWVKLDEVILVEQSKPD